MRGRLNGHGVIGRAFAHHKRAERHRRRSNVLLGVLSVVGVVAAIIFLRELPSLRRYLRIERM